MSLLVACYNSLFVILQLDCNRNKREKKFDLVWFHGISTIIGYLMPNPFSYIKTVLFQTTQFIISAQSKYQKHFCFKLFSLVNKVKWFQVLLCIINNSIKHQSFIYTQLNVKTVLFQTIQFSLSTQFSSIWPIDRTLSGATSPGQSVSGSDVNKKVLWILQSSSITQEPHQPERERERERERINWLDIQKNMNSERRIT